MEIAQSCGETIIIKLRIQNPDDTYVQLAGYSARSQVRDPRGKLIATATVTSETDATSDFFRLTIPGEVSQGIEPGVYLWDALVQDPAGVRVEYFSADLKLRRMATRWP